MIKNSKEYFIQMIQKQMKFNQRFSHSNIGYGEDVMPILEVYASLTNSDERKSFKDALKDLLTDSDPDKRDFAISVCLGFFIFRDAIGR